jgi:hypothetical protein
MPGPNPLAKAPKGKRGKLSLDPKFLSFLGQFGIANYKMGANENKGRPDPTDISTVEKARGALLRYLDQVERR